MIWVGETQLNQVFNDEVLSFVSRTSMYVFISHDLFCNILVTFIFYPLLQAGGPDLEPYLVIPIFIGISVLGLAFNLAAIVAMERACAKCCGKAKKTGNKIKNELN